MKLSETLAAFDANTERLIKRKRCPWCGAPRPRGGETFDRGQCERAQTEQRKRLVREK